MAQSVLIVGSVDADTGPELYVTAAELYDPRTGRWRDAADPELTRIQVTAALLNDGSVLMIGGRYVPRILGAVPINYPFAERYDPATDRWRPAGPMLWSRVSAAAASLPDGRVLVMGGDNQTIEFCPPCDPMSSAEIYDPSTGGWSEVTPMAQASADPTAVLLADGRVLVVGADGHTEVFQAAPTAVEAAASAGWLAPAIAGLVGGLVAACVSLAVVVACRRRGRPPNGPSQKPLPSRERRGVATK